MATAVDSGANNLNIQAEPGEGDAGEHQDAAQAQPSTSSTYQKPEESRPFLTTSVDQTKRRYRVWVFNCHCPDILFLVLKMVCLVVTIAVAVVKVYSSRKTHGECMLTATYTRLGYVDYGQNQFPCDFGLYFAIVSCAILLMTLMIDWVADIKDSIKWLIIQLILMVSQVAGFIAVFVILILEFLRWCEHIAYVLPQSKKTDACRSDVKNYQKMPEQTYKLVAVYDYTMVELGLHMLAAVCWLSLVFAAIWKLAVTVRELRISMEEEEREDDDDDDDGVIHQGFDSDTESTARLRRGNRCGDSEEEDNAH